MFDLLTRVLLWLLIGTIIWYVFIRFIPRTYLTWLGGLIVFIFVILAFVSPDNETVAAVWSILSLPLKPLGLVIFLLLSSLRGGTGKVAGNQVVAALLILFLCSTPIVAYWLASQAERTVVDTQALTAIPDEQRGTALAIVVLSDGITPANPSFRSRVRVGTADGDFRFNTDLASRLLVAGRLYQEQLSLGVDPLVIVAAGPQASLQDSANLAEDSNLVAIRDLLVSAGVPDERILIEPDTLSLIETAEATAEILANAGYEFERNSVILVAPSLTISRAVATFSSQGIRVIPQPTDQFAFQLDDGQLVAAVTDLLPNVDALALTTRVVDEYLTSVYYYLRGWLVEPLVF